ncbi:MAG: prepilin-type N-terminal cleavage/methylation domain-containing protein [Lachnospiraceae bacterium]|nr:prepilin-type N-terminal cleavage/methylation domain-containing protein [Lachnospiraceae bacterium]
MKGSQNKNKGFSLLEVLIAVVILTVVIVPLTNTFISSSKVNQKSKRVLSATDIAQNMFEGITASKPEDAILELSARSLSKNVD